MLGALGTAFVRRGVSWPNGESPARVEIELIDRISRSSSCATKRSWERAALDLRAVGGEMTPVRISALMAAGGRESERLQPTQFRCDPSRSPKQCAPRRVISYPCVRNALRAAKEVSEHRQL